MTLFEALTGEAFDRLNWRHNGELDQKFSKSQMPRDLHGVGGMGSFGIDRYIKRKLEFTNNFGSHFNGRVLNGSESRIQL